MCSPAWAASEECKPPDVAELHLQAPTRDPPNHVAQSGQTPRQLDVEDLSPGFVAGSALSVDSVSDARFVGVSPVGVLCSEPEAAEVDKDRQPPRPNAFMLALRKLAAVAAPAAATELVSAADSASAGVSPRPAPQSPEQSKVSSRRRQKNKTTKRRGWLVVRAMDRGVVEKLVLLDVGWPVIVRARSAADSPSRTRFKGDVIGARFVDFLQITLMGS